MINCKILGCPHGSLPTSRNCFSCQLPKLLVISCTCGYGYCTDCFISIYEKKLQKEFGMECIICTDVYSYLQMGSIHSMPQTGFKSCIEPTSQKVLGLKKLKNVGDLPIQPFDVICYNRKDHNNCIPITEFKLNLKLGKFWRPCPQKPRHGFVDSRIVSNKDELKSLIKEIEESGEPVELLVSTFISSSISGIWTNAGLTVGKGHDGVTSGSSIIGNLNIPLPQKITGLLPKASGHYAEMVWSKDEEPLMVQLREGPKLDRTIGDYIPYEVVVTEVLTINVAKYDWSWWEKKCESIPIGGQGTVVYLPGSPLSCHAAIHAVARKIPVITTREIKPGDILKATVTQKEINIKKIHDAFWEGLNCKWATEESEWPSTLLSAMAMVHSYPYLDLSNDTECKLFGNAAGIVVRFAGSLCLSEAKYNKTGYVIKDCQIKTFGNLYRNQVYSKTFNYSKLKFFKHVVYAWFVHTYGHFSGGFGGSNWANAADLAIQCIINASKLKHKDFDISTFVQSLNNLAVACHNGGKLFNKITSETNLNRASEYPGLYAPLLLLKTPKRIGKTKRTTISYAQLRNVLKKLQLNLNTINIHPKVFNKVYSGVLSAQIRATSKDILRIQFIGKNGDKNEIDITHKNAKILWDIVSDADVPSLYGSNAKYFNCVLDGTLYHGAFEGTISFPNNEINLIKFPSLKGTKETYALDLTDWIE